MPTISCKKDQFCGDIHLPSSKSISNRLLLMDELSGGRIHIENLSQSDDTILMQQCLKTYRNSQQIDVRNAGTVMRFMTALLAMSNGEWIIGGSERMHERPIGPLVRALKDLDADIDYIAKHNYPPLRIRGKALRGGKIVVDANISSQFISAILMVAPQMPEGLVIELTGKIQSGPYIDMTVALMKACGIQADREGRLVSVKPSAYREARVRVEEDWSSAAFLYSLVALSEKADLFLKGLKPSTVQGDAIIIEWYKLLGVKTIIEKEGIRIQKSYGRAAIAELDFTGHPDLFLPIATACAGCSIGMHATGLGNLSLKESDRIKGAVESLVHLGYDARYANGTFLLRPGYGKVFIKNTPSIQVMGDHRIAMSFALLATRFPAIRLDDTAAASKSFPGFFDQLTQLGFNISD
jgi:3-phosphoshikimate 1-carboxyvinyltransferase